MKKNLIIFFFIFSSVSIHINSSSEENSISKIINPLTKITGFAFKKSYEAVKWGVLTTAMHIVDSQKAISETHESITYNSNHSQDSESENSSHEKWDIIDIATRNPLLPYPFQTDDELEQDFKTDSTQTLAKLNSTTKKLYNEHDPKNPTTQLQIFHLFNRAQTFAEKKQAAFMPSPLLTNDLNQKQNDILNETLENHATVLEPKYRSIYDKKIEKIENEYIADTENLKNKYELKKNQAKNQLNNNLQELLTIGSTASKNATYLNECSTKKINNDGQNQDHYTSTENYQIFLQDIRSSKK